MIQVAENEKDLTTLEFDLLGRFCLASLNYPPWRKLTV